MVLDSLGVLIRSSLVDTQRDKKGHDEPMPPPAGFGERAAAFGEERRTIAAADDEASALQASQRLGHRWLGHAHALGNLDGSGFALLIDEIGDRVSFRTSASRAASPR